MIDKTSKVTDKYEPNKKVVVTVTNEPFTPDEGGQTFYKHTVTLKVDAGSSKEQLVFKSAEDVAVFFENVDYEDPQQSLV